MPGESDLVGRAGKVVNVNEVTKKIDEMFELSGASITARSLFANGFTCGARYVIAARQNAVESPGTDKQQLNYAIELLKKCCGLTKYEHSYEELHNQVLSFVQRHN